MNTINGNFVEKSIPNIKNATIALNIGGVDATMNLVDFAAVINAEPVAPYKVFTGLLTQSGENVELYVENFTTTGTQNIVKGTSYFIDVNSENVDFSSIGAPSNVVGTNFIATADKLNTDFPDMTWALRFNTGAPVAIVLENTIGNVWFTYDSPGNYYLNSIDLLIVNKTFTLNSQTRCNNINDQFYNLLFTNIDDSTFRIITLDDSLNTANDFLTSKMIEIRVYN